MSPMPHICNSADRGCPHPQKRARFCGLRLTLFLLFSALLSSHAAQLELRFEHRFDTSPLFLDAVRYRLSTGEEISVSRLSYLLSGFALEKQTGGWVELTNQFACVDAEKRRTEFALADIPADQYRALRFAVGLDSAINNSDPAKFPADHPLNPNLNGLHWSWQGGYIFLALEGMYRATNNTLEGYSYHFARGTNRTVITLPLEIRFAKSDAAAATIGFDLSALLNAPRPISPARDGVSTHSRDGDPIAASLKANLRSAFQLRELIGRGVVKNEPPVQPLYLPAKFTPYAFQMSSRFSVPALPRDNPLLNERVALGDQLFHDPTLSRNYRVSCASCHEPEHAFSDPRQFSVGVEERTGTRNAMPLFNMAWKSDFFWDGRAPSLRAQALIPIQDHAEMDENLTNLVQKLAKSAAYSNSFTEGFGSPDITAEKIGLALENFVLTLTSFDSRLDQAMRGEANLNADEKRGFELFFQEYEPRMGQRGADCFHCHGGALFSDHQFHNNGLDATHDKDAGRFNVTTNAADRGKFSTPSLRNVALTAPYMHDGRFKTLEEVVEHYSIGVKRTPTLDPNLAKHPVGGLQLSAEDKRALVAFLKTLTDPKFEPPNRLAAKGH
jgi:cytochrome c peroxidase